VAITKRDRDVTASRRKRAVFVQFALILAGVVVACLVAFDVSQVQRYDRMALYATVAIGLTLLTGYAGLVSLGQGAFFLIGAYAAALFGPNTVVDPETFSTHQHSWLNPLLAIFLATLVTAAVAAVVGVPLLRLRGHYLAFATLALHLIAIQVVFAQSSVFGSENGVSVAKELQIGSWAISGRTHAAVAWCLVGVALVLSLNLIRSRTGRALQAIAASERGAAATGINVPTVKLRLFVVAAALAGLAGALFAYQFALQNVSPRSVTLLISIQFVVMVAVGGLGNIYGAVVGAIVITYLEDKLREVGQQSTLLGWHPPSQMPQVLQLGVYAVILIVVMIAFPRGLVPALGTAFSAAKRRLLASRASA
jgi:branched-chain amino acid transport system permease protein